MADDVKQKTPETAADVQTTSEQGALFGEIGGNSEVSDAQDRSRTSRGIEAMMDVRMNVQIVLGQARMPIAELLKLGRGSVVELDRQVGEPVDVLVNDTLVARGNLVKLAGDRIGVTLTEVMRGAMAES
jgi:flagellar motor switch protein FliN/FliY